MKNREYSKPGFGFKIQVEAEPKGISVRWSGESMWLAEDDPGDSLEAFVCEILASLDETTQVEIHVEELSAFNSSTMHVIDHMVLQSLRAGCSVRLSYLADSHTQNYKIDRLKRHIPKPMIPALEFVEVAQQKAV